MYLHKKDTHKILLYLQMKQEEVICLEHLAYLVRWSYLAREKRVKEIPLSCKGIRTWKSCVVNAVELSPNRDNYILILDVKLTKGHEISLHIDAMLHYVVCTSSVDVDTRSIANDTKVFLYNNQLLRLVKRTIKGYSHKLLPLYYLTSLGIFLELKKNEKIYLPYNTIYHAYESRRCKFSCDDLQGWKSCKFEDMEVSPTTLRLKVTFMTGWDMYIDINEESQIVTFMYDILHTAINEAVEINNVETLLRANEFIISRHAKEMRASCSGSPVIQTRKMSLINDAGLTIKLMKIVNSTDHEPSNGIVLSYKKIPRWKSCYIHKSSSYFLSMRVKLVSNDDLWIICDVRELQIVTYKYRYDLTAITDHEIQQDIKTFFNENRCIGIIPRDAIGAPLAAKYHIHESSHAARKSYREAKKAYEDTGKTVDLSELLREMEAAAEICNEEHHRELQSTSIVISSYETGHQQVFVSKDDCKVLNGVSVEGFNAKNDKKRKNTSEVTSNDTGHQDVLVSKDDRKGKSSASAEVCKANNNKKSKNTSKEKDDEDSIPLSDAEEEQTCNKMLNWQFNYGKYM